MTTRARLQLAAWTGGIVAFFSDLGTPLIVGPAFRSLADGLGMSRAKLAWIIDSTAAPVATLVPFIGWGVYIMSLLDQQFGQLGRADSDFGALVRALPYQFYAWLAVAPVPLLALAGRDFGPMAAAERVQVADAPGALGARTGRVRPAERGRMAPAPAVPVGARASFIRLPLLVLAGLTAWYGVSGLLDSVRGYLDGLGRMMQVAVMLLLAWALGNGALRVAGYLAAGIASTPWLLVALLAARIALVCFAVPKRG